MKPTHIVLDKDLSTDWSKNFVWDNISIWNFTIKAWSACTILHSII